MMLIVPSDQVQDPDFHWWNGQTACTACGYGTTKMVQSVIEIPRTADRPTVPMQCPACMTFNLRPVELA